MDKVNKNEKNSENVGDKIKSPRERKIEAFLFYNFIILFSVWVF